jgi:hypothetical protein
LSEHREQENVRLGRLEPDPGARSPGAAPRRVRALLPAEQAARLGPWLDRLGAALSDRGVTLERLELRELDRPTPARRLARAQGLGEGCGPERLELLLDGGRVPLEVHAALTGRGARLVTLVPRPVGSLSDALPSDDPPADRSLPPRDTRPPAALGAAIARCLTSAPLGFDPAEDPAPIAAQLCATTPPERTVEHTDLVAVALHAEEDYRRLALWCRDLAEQAADLERGRGPTTAWRALVRRVRRFLRKRGLA